MRCDTDSGLLRERLKSGLTVSSCSQLENGDKRDVSWFLRWDYDLNFTCDQNHQRWANNVLYDLEEAQLETDQCDEHERQQDTSGELHEVLGFVLAHAWNASKKWTSFTSWLGENQKKCSDEGQVSEQELNIPEDWISDGLKERNLLSPVARLKMVRRATHLKHDDEEQKSTSDLDT